MSAPAKFAVCECTFCISTDLDENLLSSLSVLSDSIPDETKEVLIYVSGYIQLRVDSTQTSADYVDDRDSFSEYAVHCNYFDSVNRGGLTVPRDSLVLLCYYCYVAFVIISVERMPCYNKIMQCCKAINCSYKLVPHERQQLACRTITNILLNNFTRAAPRPNDEEKIKRIKLSQVM
jgi:hypothetical protein